jgi:hypothetical protein
MIDVKKIMELASGSIAEIDEAAKTGNIVAVEAFLSARRNPSLKTIQTHRWLADIIDGPKDYAAPYRLYESLAKNSIDYDALFGDEVQIEATVIHEDGSQEPFDIQKFNTSRLWGMNITDPREETVKTSAALLSEYLKFRMVRDESYKIDFTNIVEDLMEEHLDMSSSDISEAIIATQNALVDYVAEQGPVQPLNRGAAYLSLVENDVHHSLSSLWMKKVSMFRETSVDSVRQGSYIKLQPQFM